MIDWQFWLHRNWYDILLLFLILLMFVKRDQKNVVERWVMYYLIVYFTGDILATLIGMKTNSTQWLFNVQSFCFLLAITQIYWRLLQDSRTRKKIWLVFVPIALVYFIYPLVTHKFTVVNTYAVLSFQFASAFFAFMYMKRYVESTDDSPAMNFPFWFCAATIIDSTGSIPTVGMYSTIAWTKPEIIIQLFNIMDVMNVIYYALILVGFLWTRKMAI